MAEPAGRYPRPTDLVGRFLFDASRAVAVAGGIVLTAMAVLITVSVTGRAALSEPIPGDFEIVSIGVGLAVFAFLPWCQITRANVLVDFFLTRAPARIKLACDAIGALCYLAIASLLTWRLALGGVDMYRYAEKTMTINFPRWTTFPVSLLLMLLLVAVVAYTLGRSIAEVRAGHEFTGGTDDLTRNR